MKKICCIVASLFVVALVALRIYQVNHQEWIQRYAAEIVVHEESETVAMPNAFYYMSGERNLSGYHIRAKKTELMSVAEFLDVYDITEGDFAKLLEEGGEYYEEYRYLYLVTVEIYNDEWQKVEDEGMDSVSLDDFVLVGPDYWEFTRTRDVNRVPNFNPELYGASRFGIASERIFEITLPYLIKSTSTDDSYAQHILKYPPKLLISSYPTAIYMELPNAA